MIISIKKEKKDQLITDGRIYDFAGRISLHFIIIN